MKDLGKIGGQPQHKRYWLMDKNAHEPIETFDNLEQAKIYRGPGLRADRQYVIRDRGRKIVWPAGAKD